MSLFYTGVGSRETPGYILDIMVKLGYYLEAAGVSLRTGGAPGADQAFEEGWWKHQMWNGEGTSKGRIYIPWNGFYDRLHHGDAFGAVVSLPHIPYDLGVRAQQIAQQFHPAWDHLSPGAKKLHTRNVFQVLGDDLETPSEFLICFAIPNKDGSVQGGTNTAVKLADAHGVRVTNLHNEESRGWATEWIKKMEDRYGTIPE